MDLHIKIIILWNALCLIYFNAHSAKRTQVRRLSPSLSLIEEIKQNDKYGTAESGMCEGGGVCTGTCGA